MMITTFSTNKNCGTFSPSSFENHRHHFIKQKQFKSWTDFIYLLIKTSIVLSIRLESDTKSTWKWKLSSSSQLFFYWTSSLFQLNLSTHNVDLMDATIIMVTVKELDVVQADVGSLVNRIINHHRFLTLDLATVSTIVY